MKQLDEDSVVFGQTQQELGLGVERMVQMQKGRSKLESRLPTQEACEIFKGSINWGIM